MNDFIASIAPTLASALLGPLGGVAVAGLGKILGIDGATQKDIAKAIESGRVTPEQLAEIKKLELQLKNEEAERGFKYSELQFKDTASARDMQMATRSYTPSVLTGIVVTLTLAAEGAMLFNAIPPGADPIILGRILGTMDGALMLVLGFWFGSSNGSQNKDALLANSMPSKTER